MRLEATRRPVCQTRQPGCWRVWDRATLRASASEYIVVNEVSTVATAFALAGFATDTTHISSSSSALATMGMADAFNSITNLETLTGFALATTPAGNGTVPQSEIDTLANILAACVNTNGSTAPTDPCGELFSYTTIGSTVPSDTAMAAINLAHNPGANIAGLCALQAANGPFQPSLPCASPDNLPNDFTIAINYTGGGLDGSGFAPEGIAIDGLGNVWVPNYASSSVSELSPLGVRYFGLFGNHRVRRNPKQSDKRCDRYQLQRLGREF